MLEVLDCTGCGACCTHMVSPPFLCLDDDEEFAALKTRRPDLAAELVADIERRIRDGDRTDDAPCTWLDPGTMRCRHYEDRPEICREFEMGSEDCLAHRGREGIDAAAETSEEVAG